MERACPTIRLAVAAIVDAHRSVGLESPQTTGVTETLRGLSRQVGVSQKQARPLDADALAAIRATALNPRKARGGSFELEETSLRRRRLDIALACVLSDAGLRISEAANLRWRDVLDAENDAGLVYIERSKTDQVGEGAYVVITPDTLAALKRLREDTGAWTDDEPGIRVLDVADKSPRCPRGTPGVKRRLRLWNGSDVEMLHTWLLKSRLPQVLMAASKNCRKCPSRG